MKKILIPAIIFLSFLFADCQSKPVPRVYDTDTFTMVVESAEIMAGDTFVVEHMDMIRQSIVRSTSSFVAQEDGHVMIEDTIPSFAELRLKCIGKTSDYGLTFYVEPGQDLLLNAPSLKHMDVVPEGGFYQDNVLREYFLSEAERDSRIKKCMDDLNFYTQNRNDDSIGVLIDRVLAIQKRTPEDWKYIRSILYRKDCPVAAYMYAKEVGLYDMKSNKIDRHWRKLNPEVKQSGAGQWYSNIVNIRKSLKKGAKATDFTLSCTDGSTVSLHELRGKYVLLYNWGICGYVLQSAPDLINLHEKYPENLEVIALTDSQTFSSISSTENPDPVTAPLLSLLNQNWKTAVNDRSGNEQITIDYLMTFTPCVVLISPNGRIVRWGDAGVLKTANRRLR